jgi:hypothetical protein
VFQEEQKPRFMAGQGKHLKLALSLNPGCLVTSPVTTARLLFLFCWPCLLHIALTCMVLLGSDDGREAETRNPVTMLSIHK